MPDHAMHEPGAEVTEDKALIDQYTQEALVPPPLEKWYRAFEQDRAYVNDKCMVLDAQDAVGTNHILRNQYTLMSTLVAREADIRIAPDEAVWEPQPQPMIDPIMGTPVIDPMTGQPVIADYLPGEPPRELMQFAKTCEVLVRKILRESRWRQQLAGAVQDIETNALMFVKVNQQEDYARDPLGRMRFDDQQDNYALYRHMRERFEAGEFEPETAEHAKFKQLEATVREYLAIEMQQEMANNPYMPPVDAMGQPMMDEMGQPMMDPRIAELQGIQSGEMPLDMERIPEIPRYIGFPIDFINPEDVRFSWDITRPEDFFRSRRTQHRVPMRRNAAAAKYGLSPEDAKKLKKMSPGHAQGVGEDVSTHNDQLTNTELDDEVELWECWDRETNRVNVYSPGFPRFLHSYTPRVVWRHWCPIIPVMFNRVTGRFVGVSSTTLQRPAQEEINLMRTLDRHAKKACFPRILARKGIFQKGEKSRYKKAMPYEIIELETPDEIMSAIKETATVTYNPALTDSSRAEIDLQRMSGTSLVAGGTVGVSKSATETATAQAGQDSMTSFKQGILEDLTVDVATCVLDMANIVLPEENVKAWVGPGAFWPRPDNETLWRHMSVRVQAGSMGKPDTDKRLGWMTNASQLARNFGLVAKGPAIMDFLAREAGVFEGLSQFFEMGPPPMPGGMGGPAGPGGPPPPTGGPPPTPPGPDSQQGQGGGGGSPVKGPPKPESIPNRPQV